MSRDLMLFGGSILVGVLGGLVAHWITHPRSPKRARARFKREAEWFIWTHKPKNRDEVEDARYDAEDVLVEVVAKIKADALAAAKKEAKIA